MHEGLENSQAKMNFAIIYRSQHGMGYELWSLRVLSSRGKIKTEASSKINGQ